MDRTVLIMICVAVFVSGCVANAATEIRYQDPDNPDYSITFYQSNAYPGYDGTFEINEKRNVISGTYTETPNTYILRMANGLGCTIEKTGDGIKTLEGYEWVRN